MREAQYTIKYFGWYSNPRENSDKIWGWCEVEGKIYNFWGKRGGSLQFKRHPDGWYGSSECNSKRWDKEAKGYGDHTANIEAVYPDFHREFKKQLATARMLGKVLSESFE